LESSHYLRNQLLRDADWAGMAHGIEIRVPLVDVMLLKALAPMITKLAPGAGKAALAAAPSIPLPEAVVNRAKTGFSVPTGTWMAAVSQCDKLSESAREPRGLVSRRWSRIVLADAGNPTCQARAS
jgi:asparagine synthase (glutamine-hydrolysing)